MTLHSHDHTHDDLDLPAFAASERRTLRLEPQHRNEIADLARSGRRMGKGVLLAAMMSAAAAMMNDRGEQAIAAGMHPQSAKLAATVDRATGMRRRIGIILRETDQMNVGIADTGQRLRRMAGLIPPAVVHDDAPSEEVEVPGEWRRRSRSR
jgi:hypothetical protein